ncbi:MAG: hypothetical protein SNJ56_00730 [Termitinemataceae bacterium]
MISREDFIFTIGYDGPSAIIDGQAKRLYAKLSTKELAEKGLFRTAYASALYSQLPEELQAFISVYNQVAHTNYDSTYPFDRLFGVFPIQDKIQKVLVL